MCEGNDITYSTAFEYALQVTRDRMLRDWEFIEKGITPDRQFGSGYTSGLFIM